MRTTGEKVAIGVLAATAVGLGAFSFYEMKKGDGSVSAEALGGAIVAGAATVGVFFGGHRHPIMGGFIGAGIPIALALLGSTVKNGLPAKGNG